MPQDKVVHRQYGFEIVMDTIESFERFYDYENRDENGRPVIADAYVEFTDESGNARYLKAVQDNYTVYYDGMVINPPAPPRDVSVYDILPYFDSYIADMENNLQGDPDTWALYETNRVPFIIDLLGDFGEGDWTPTEIKNAAERHERTGY